MKMEKMKKKFWFLRKTKRLECPLGTIPESKKNKKAQFQVTFGWTDRIEDFKKTAFGPKKVDLFPFFFHGDKLFAQLSTKENSERNQTRTKENEEKGKKTRERNCWRKKKKN